MVFPSVTFPILAVIPVEFEDIKINFLDTTGYFDFVGEVEEACHAAGAAVIVINGKSGVEVGTLKAWELCEKYKLPRLIFITIHVTKVLHLRAWL